MITFCFWFHCVTKLQIRSQPNLLSDLLVLLALMDCNATVASHAPVTMKISQ